MIPKAIVHLLSGGLDSVTMLHDLHRQGEKLHCVLFDYGQPHVKELEFAKAHCHKLGILYTLIQLPKLGGLTEGHWVIPNRNSVLLSLAVNLAMQHNADTVTFAANKDDESGFADCRMAFVQMFNKLLIAAEIPVEVCAPYLTWPKRRIATLATQMGIAPKDTWSCYRGGKSPCGTCPACLKLLAAYDGDAS